MSRYVLSPRARADLEDIWNYTVSRWSEEQAERYLGKLQQAFDILEANPRRAPPCDDIRSGYRRYSVENHVVFFRIVDGVIDVVRVLHQSMDFDRNL